MSNPNQVNICNCKHLPLFSFKPYVSLKFKLTVGSLRLQQLQCLTESIIGVDKTNIIKTNVTEWNTYKTDYLCQ